MLFEVVHDRGLQLGDGVEGAATDAFFGDLGEEALDQVEPGGGGRSEVQMEARMRREPASDLGGLMGGVVVEDQVKVEIGRRLLVDLLQKP